MFYICLSWWYYQSVFLRLKYILLSYLGQEPFECYNISDIETGLGLGRNHLIAVSLLVGSDHDLNGISGIGLDTAVRFVKNFSEDEILNRYLSIVF